MIAQLQKILAVVMTVLGAVLPILSPDTALRIAPILTKVSTLLGGLAGMQPGSNADALIADLVQALGALQASGIIHDTAPIDEALATIAKFQAVEADYKNGQVALISSKFMFDGIAGDLIAVSRGGAAAQSLGL